MATLQFESELNQNTPLGGGFFRLSFSWPASAAPVPGQFLSLRVSSSPVPLLRRPFAFSHYDPSTSCASIIVKTRGRATELLSRKRPGDTLEIIGPRGTAFPQPQREHRPVLLAGGIGLGPILFLASTFKARGFEPTLVFGCRSRDELPCAEELAELEARICTDDGSEGFRGTVVDYLKHALSVENAELYACGPNPMLAEIAGVAEAHRVPCWVSMEQTMGCSMGACMGCVIRTHHPSGYARVCTEGPVFDSREIRWT